LETLQTFSKHEKVVAIGEIGLDYYRDNVPRTLQQHAFQKQLHLAADLKLPVIIHNRNSDTDLLKLLGESNLMTRSKYGVLHSFSASWETANSALKLGFYLGFTGPVTFKKADSLREIIARIPIERIVVETDAPFLAPQQFRGKRNEPSYIPLIAERIAAIKDLPLSEFARISSRNAVDLFGSKIAL
jgi:TatD DNase family protein